MTTEKIQAGFARRNRVEHKNNTRVLTISVIIGMIILLYFVFNVSSNLLLKKNHYLDSSENLLWFTPNEIFFVIKSFWFNNNIIKLEVLMFYLAPFSVLLLITALLIRATQSALSSSSPTGERHGSASFDSAEEIEDSGLIVKDLKQMIESGQSGVSLGMADLGKGKKVYLIERSQNEHILCYAPSRSGKGVGLVIPSLLMWNDSSITLDPKGENWDITSGFLSKKGFDCIRLDLGAPYFRYNPLSELDPRSVDLPDEVRRMIGVICGEGSKGDNKFFDDQAKDLLTGCLTYLIITYNDPIPGSEEEFIINASKKEKPSITLYDVAIYLSGIDPRTGKAYEGGTDDQGNPISPFVAQYSQMANYLQDYAHHYVTQLESYQLVGEFIEATGQKFLKQATAAEKTFQSIVSSADQNLAIFKLPIIRAVTAYSDFKLKQLVDPLHKPTALYIVNPPKDELTGKTDGVIKIILQNLFVSVLYETGLRTATKDNTYGYTKRAVLCMLDEFPKLGKFEIMEKLLADAAGYGAKFYLIAQSDKQINKAYEKENSIFAGCQHKVMYRPADQDTAKSLSELLGNYTYIEKTVNVSDGDTGKIDILKSKSASKSWNESSRALMTQDEIMSMEDDEAIILSKSHKIFGRKLRYYLDPYLSTITKIKAPELQMKPIITDEETFKKRMQVKGIDINQKISEYKEHLENTKNPQKSTSETNEMYDKSNLTD